MAHSLRHIIIAVFLLYSCEEEPSSTKLSEKEVIVNSGSSPKGSITNHAQPQGELSIEDLKPGKGSEVKQNQTLKVNYKAFFESGFQFDSTEKRGKPFTFTLGEGTVIKGWEQGLKGMKVGTVRRLTVPPHLAYGDKGISGLVPPGSTLIFEIELLGIEAD